MLAAHHHATEHPSDTHEASSEKTKRPRLRRGDVGCTHTDVSDALSQLPLYGEDVLSGRAGYDLPVIEHALNGAAQSVGQVLLSRRAGQRPGNRTNERSSKDSA